mmetsp:Transcript_31934/g.85278  ORF Transcript_31934/g.85278 Transcript_31934/m.85278 type:complete len:265 (-) Transcript_31934:588-1382(-)
MAFRCHFCGLSCSSTSDSCTATSDSGRMICSHVTARDLKERRPASALPTGLADPAIVQSKCTPAGSLTTAMAHLSGVREEPVAHHVRRHQGARTVYAAVAVDSHHAFGHVCQLHEAVQHLQVDDVVVHLVAQVLHEHALFEVRVGVVVGAVEADDHGHPKIRQQVGVEGGAVVPLAPLVQPRHALGEVPRRLEERQLARHDDADLAVERARVVQELVEEHERLVLRPGLEHVPEVDPPQPLGRRQRAPATLRRRHVVRVIVYGV